jgi:uracil-DNA glycosylase
MDNLKKLQNEILKCNLCKKFWINPKPIVRGNKNAKIFQISQAPSEKAVISCKPFTDQTWKKLRQRLDISEKIFYNPNIFYFSHIWRCFPGKTKNGNHKLPPKYVLKNDL